MKPGDYCFKQDDKGFYRVCRILRIDVDTDIAHVSTYEPLAMTPTSSSMEAVKPVTWHAPIRASSFADWQTLAGQPLIDDDLSGFHAYLKMTNFKRYIQETGQNLTEIIKNAKALYGEAGELHDKKDYLKAIDKYHQAYDLFPSFFEAKDNEAFCHMSLGNYKNAIDCFEESINSNGHTFLADFSIGECFFKMKDSKNALSWFERAKRHENLKPESLAHLDKYMQAINSAN